MRLTPTWGVVLMLALAGVDAAYAQTAASAQRPAAFSQTTAPAVSATSVAPVLTSAAPASAAPASIDTAATRAIDPRDLSAYVDGLVDAGMQHDHIAGVTVAVVDREGPLLLRGYGISAQTPERPVSPERSLFRIGSVSKTFTYLLGLKLVDSGRIKLDAPVNDYLPAALKLADDGFKPVLVRHLFTHTAGYEDSAMGHLFTDRDTGLSTLDDYLIHHRPKRVREPGLHAVYSNYSVALLGALIAHVEGVDFDTLVERELLTPMGMTLSTFREPLPDSDPRHAPSQFNGLWSEGFQRSSGGFKRQAFEHVVQIAPAGGASSNAADMARYLRMLINGGQLDGAQILSPGQFARLNGEPLFRNAPGGTGFSYGFFKRRYGQIESLEHGGATSWFHTDFVAVPALGVGIFVSTNTDTARKFAAELPKKILEHFFVQARPVPLPAVVEHFDASRFVGEYFSERSNYTSAEKLLLNTSATIAPVGGGLLLTIDGDDTRWLPEGGLRFREAEGGGHMTFFADGQGKITRFASSAGHNVFARAGFFNGQNTLPMALGSAFCVSILVFVAAWLRRGRRQREHKHRDQPAARLTSAWMLFTAMTWIVFIAVFGFAVLRMLDNTTEAFYRFPGIWFTTALWLSPLAMLMTIVCAWRSVSVWRTREWKFWRKFRHTSVVAIYLFAAWVLWSWNLVGWKL